MSDDERFLRRAIELAARARAAGEDPFGAVLPNRLRGGFHRGRTGANPSAIAAAAPVVN